MLATGDTHVKLLLPEVAVVHAQMTLGPRTTIVSFVVHRVGERWLCASAHSTDVIPDQDTNAIGSGPRVRFGAPSEADSA